MGGDGYAAAPRPWKKPNYRRYKRCSRFLLGTVLDTSERRVILARRRKKEADIESWNKRVNDWYKES